MKRKDLLATTQKERLQAYGKQRRHFELSTEQWEELDLLCKELGILSPTVNKGEPSIGGLLRNIADKQLVVLPDPEPPALIDVYNERMARSRNRRITSRMVLARLKETD